jgi:hypothetical protein
MVREFALQATFFLVSLSTSCWIALPFSSLRRPSTTCTLMAVGMASSSSWGSGLSRQLAERLFFTQLRALQGPGQDCRFALVTTGRGEVERWRAESGARLLIAAYKNAPFKSFQTAKKSQDTRLTFASPSPLPLKAHEIQPIQPGVFCPPFFHALWQIYKGARYTGNDIGQK